MSAAYQIPPGQSVVLNCVRILATLAVFLGHATKPDVLFDVDIALIGRATIPVFLMLSGYFLARAVSAGGQFKTAVLKRYFGLYHVVLPGIVILFLADLWLVQAGSPILENSKFDSEISVHRFLVETFQALTFSGAYWRVDPLSQGLFANQSYWTVEYIMAYMAATSAIYLLSGFTRFAVVAVIALIAGPTILLLSPLWFAGVVAFEIHKQCHAAWVLECSGRADEAARWPRFVRSWAPLYGAIGLIVVVYIERSGLGSWVYDESKTWASFEFRQHLGMAKRFAWQWMLVPGLFLIVVASKYLIYWTPSEKTRNWTKRVARHNLPIYMFHFSMIYVVQSMIPDYQPHWWSPDPYLMMAGALVLTLSISIVCSRYVKPIADRVLAKALS
ncbi:MAG: acyltransferase family protein [Pseudomonadota bacterium]